MTLVIELKENYLTILPINHSTFFHYLDRVGSPVIVTTREGNMKRGNTYEAFGMRLRKKEMESFIFYHP
ncbi:hypothetical protein KAW18_09495 [candidate division WOR-3 bacterium]|nr:hypothetical protein [candidate division WOR-3 bacterium]